MTTIFIQNLRITTGEKDQRPQKPVTISQDSDANLLLSFFDEYGQYVDVSGATAWALKILENDNLTVLTKTPAVVAGRVNQMLTSFLAADMALLPPGFNDMELFFTLDGVNYAYNLYGALEVQPSVLSVP